MYGLILDNDEVESMDDEELLARTIWGEARGDGAPGMEAVASVIMNRAKHGGWWGNDIKSVCLKPYQFSCWLVGDPNLSKLLSVNEEDPSFQVALDISGRATKGTLVDTTDGCDSYLAESLKKIPEWARNLTPWITIGHQNYYRTI